MTMTECSGEVRLPGERNVQERTAPERAVQERAAPGHAVAGGPARPGEGWSPAWVSGWQPLAGTALLDRLRVTGRARPVADLRLVADLRSLLEHDFDGIGGSASGHASLVGRDAPLMVTKDRLTRSLACATHASADPTGERECSLPLACGALVGVLFRQLVATGSIGDPLADGMDGLGVDEHQAPLVAWIGQLAPDALSELRSEVERQTDGLRRRWPVLDPAWLPRTQECIRVPLADGRIELVARVDLAIGRPPVDEASVALVDVTSGSRWPAHRADRHLYALVETLRSTTPPFAVATYYTRTGELEVDPVTPDLLVDAARRCRAGIAVLAGQAAGTLPEATDRPWCAACARSPQPTVGRPAIGGLVPAPTPEPLSAVATATVAPPGAADEVIPLTEDRAA